MRKQRWALPSSPWHIAALLAVCNGLSILDRQTLNLLAQDMKPDLNITDVQIGLLQGPSFIVPYILFSLPLGRIADTADCRRLVIAGALVIWSLSTISFGLGQSLPALFASRCGVGIGEAALVPLAYSILADIFDRERIGRAIAIFLLGATVGSGCGLILTGTLFEYISQHSLGLSAWRMTFIMEGLPGLLLAVLIVAFMREPERSSANSAQKKSLRSAARFVLGNRATYIPIWVGYVALGMTMSSFLAWTPTYLMRTFDQPASNVGRVFGTVTFISGFISPWFAGVLADVIYRRQLAFFPLDIACALFALIGCFAFLAYLPTSFPLALFGIAVLSLLAQGLSVPLALTVRIVSPAHTLGQMSALCLLISNLIGFVTGPVAVPILATTVFQAEGLRVALPTMLTAAGVVGACACWVGRRRKPG